MANIEAAGYRESDDSLPTSPTLLDRVRDRGDQQAWADFVGRYGPRIRRWCLRWCRPQEVGDLEQEVMVKLVAGINKINYDPEKGSFRAWLYLVTSRAVTDLLRKRRRQILAINGGTDVQEILAREKEEGAELEELLVEKLAVRVCEEAQRRVRCRVKDQTWRAYVMTEEEGRMPIEVARELGMRVGTLYQAVHSVRTRLDQEKANLLKARAEDWGQS